MAKNIKEIIILLCMDITTLILIIGAVLIVLFLIKLALGVAKTFAKVALVILVIIVAVMILMKAGVLPDWADKSVDDIKDMAEDKIKEITENVSSSKEQELNETPEEGDSLYPPGYIEQGDQDNEVLW